MNSIIGLDSSILHNIFESAQLLVSFCIALRALYLYRKVRNPRLFILWLALSIIVLTSASSIVGDNHLLLPLLNTNWFKYVGQTVSFLFIWLSAFRHSEPYLRRLQTWHIIISLLLVVFLLTTPLLPPFPNTWTQVTFSTMRAVVSLLVFFQYQAFFFAKASRFSLLMGLAFLLISFGYFVIFPKYLFPHQDLLTNTGDGIRIFGLLVLLIAYLVG